MLRVKTKTITDPTILTVVETEELSSILQTGYMNHHLSSDTIYTIDYSVYLHLIDYCDWSVYQEVMPGHTLVISDLLYIVRHLDG